MTKSEKSMASPSPTPIGKNPNQKATDAEEALANFVQDAVEVEMQKLELEEKLIEAERTIHQLQIELATRLELEATMIPAAEHLTIVEETKASIKADATNRAKQMIEEAKQQWRQEGKGYAERQRQKLTEQYEQELTFLRTQLESSDQALLGDAHQKLQELHQERAALESQLQQAMESNQTYVCPLRLADLDRVDGHVALQNHSNMDVSLAAWTIHAPATGKVFEFPDETMLAAGASVSIWWGTKNKLRHGPRTNSYCWSRFETKSKAESDEDLFGEGQHCVLHLCDPAGSLIQEFAMDVGISPDGSSITAMPRSRTFSSASDGTDLMLVSPYHRSTGPLSICKLTIDPFSVVIRNDSAEPVDLSGWSLTADGSAQSYLFERGRILPPNSGYRIISNDIPDTNPITLGSPGARHVIRWSGTRFVQDSGDILVLRSNTNLVVCSMVVPALQPEQSAQVASAADARVAKRLHNQFANAAAPSARFSDYMTEQRKRLKSDQPLDASNCVMS